MMPGDLIDQPLDPAVIIDPPAGGIVEGLRDVDAEPHVCGAGVKMQFRMLLVFLAATIGLTARTVLEHERAADKWPVC